MAGKLTAPALPKLSDSAAEDGQGAPRPPEIKGVARREKPDVAALVGRGFVADASSQPTSAPPAPSAPSDDMDRITLMLPRRVKTALFEEVNRRRADPQRRSVAALKSVILEALAANGFGDVISPEDIQSNSGVYLKRQAAATRKG